MPASKREEDNTQKLAPRLVPGIFVGFKLHPGGVWRDKYLVIDFDAFRDTRIGLHITEHNMYPKKRMSPVPPRLRRKHAASLFARALFDHWETTVRLTELLSTFQM